MSGHGEGRGSQGMGDAAMCRQGRSWSVVRVSLGPELTVVCTQVCTTDSRPRTIHPLAHQQCRLCNTVFVSILWQVLMKTYQDKLKRYPFSIQHSNYSKTLNANFSTKCENIHPVVNRKGKIMAQIEWFW